MASIESHAFEGCSWLKSLKMQTKQIQTVHSTQSGPKISNVFGKRENPTTATVGSTESRVTEICVIISQSHPVWNGWAGWADQRRKITEKQYTSQNLESSSSTNCKPQTVVQLWKCKGLTCVDSKQFLVGCPYQMWKSLLGFTKKGWICWGLDGAQNLPGPSRHGVSGYPLSKKF